MHKLYPLFIATALLTSCSGSTETTEKSTPYEMMHIAFEGEPEVEEFKPMLEAVMQRYNMEVNDENAEKVGSMLVSLRKESKVGVTEMDILKHIYQHGSSAETLPNQAGLSAAYLEKTK